MRRSNPKWLVPAALTLVGFGSICPAAIAQTSYTFSANYDTLNNTRNITSDILQVSPSWKSTNAPYGLTNLSGLAYSQTDFATGKFSFDTDPTKFGLQGEPTGLIVLEGSGSDKLFATDSASAVVDFQTLTATTSGTYTITGGEGRFTGANGTLDFSEVGTLSLEPNTPFKGRAEVKGSFQVLQVPEPKSDTALVVMGVFGVGVLRRRRCQSSKRRVFADSFVVFPTSNLRNL